MFAILENIGNLPVRLAMSALYSQKRNVRNYKPQQSGLPQMKVTLIGAAGKVGQPLSLMLKQSSFVDELALLDVGGTCGLSIELSHIDTKCKVNAYAAADGIDRALDGAKLVVLLAACQNTSHLPFDEMFKVNRVLVKDYATACSKFCPGAIIAIATHPITTMVPIVSEVLKKCGTYNPHKIFGITTLHTVRSNTFVGNILGIEPECVTVPVIGGGYERNVVPLLSQAKPCSDFTLAEIQLLTNNIQMARNDIINVKRCEDSTLAAAFSISRFVISLIKGLLGKSDVVECAYVRSIIHPRVKYLSTPLQLGPGGIQKNLGIPTDITDYENCLLDTALSEILRDTKKGEQYLGIKDSKDCDICDPKNKGFCPPVCKPQSLYD
nr:malate dehydrogenase, mitochondrial-like [Onthophagus taurus]